MKFKKALSLLPAMLLVLSLGACSESTEGGSSAEVRDDAAYTVSIIITYDGETQEVPEYASIYYSGEANNWGFTELAKNGTAYELYFDEIPEAGDYEFGLVIEAKGTALEDVGWSHKVNQGSGNETFTVLGTEEEGYVNSVSVEAGQLLTDLFPDPALGDAENVTFRFTVTSKTVTGYDLYLVGSFNNDSAWTNWYLCTYNETNSTYDYTFATLATGTIEYKVTMITSGTTPNGTWNDVTEITTANQSVNITTDSSNTVIEVTI